MNEGIITPVTCVSSATLAGIDMLLKEISLLLPVSTDEETAVAADKDGSPVEIKCDISEPFSAFVFKTVADPFVGKMSFIKVMSGKIQTV